MRTRAECLIDGVLRESVIGTAARKAAPVVGRVAKASIGPAGLKAARAVAGATSSVRGETVPGTAAGTLAAVGTAAVLASNPKTAKFIPIAAPVAGATAARWVDNRYNAYRSKKSPSIQTAGHQDDHDWGDGDEG